jgi:signal transduction histidine kinase
MIGNCTDNLLGLISKMEIFMRNNQQPANIEVCSPTELVEEIRSEFKHQLDEYAIELQGNHTIPSWNADKKRILEILKHLVTNSISFHDKTKEMRQIVVSITGGKRNTILKVTDNGLGIQEDQQGRVFDIFFRASTETIGHGMGLFLAKELADKMGATIACKSTIGKGTTISLTIPNHS